MTIVHRPRLPRDLIRQAALAARLATELALERVAVVACLFTSCFGI